MNFTRFSAPLIIFLMCCCSDGSAPAKDPYTVQRHGMVEKQIMRRGIRDEKVLAAMRKVPRHLFVPDSVRTYAYEDEPLPIGFGQTVSQPYIVALMTELLALEKDSNVLEIGTGSGYQAAVLAEIADSVNSIEIICDLAERADSTLRSLGYEVDVRCGDGYKGWPEKVPFDAIIITAAPEEIPQVLFDQLAEGGRMVVPVGTYHQELQLVEKINGEMQATNIIPVRFVPMVGESEEESS